MNKEMYALHKELHCCIFSCAPKLWNHLGKHQALPAESNEVVCPTFHCEESLGRNRGSLSHAGGSCCLPVARRCRWGGPGALLGWRACCSPWRSWRAPSGFQRGCFQCGHYSSWRAATRKRERGSVRVGFGGKCVGAEVYQGKRGFCCHSGSAV